MRNLLILLVACLIAITMSTQAKAASNVKPVGFRTLDIQSIPAVAWYPTESKGPVTTVGNSSAFVGVPVIENAVLSGRQHPVVILSHGYSGMWRNQAWLAERLARSGYIAVALNHPGTTFGDIDPGWATHIQTRAHQVSQLLDWLLEDSSFSSKIDKNRIGVIGFSQGAVTALLLAGGVFEPGRFLNACGNSTHIVACNAYRKSGLNAGMHDVSARDPRISAIVMLGMEGIRGFRPKSLAKLPVPVLALVASIDSPALPLEWEGRAEAALLPPASSRYAEIVGATHFSFMSICAPGAEKILQSDAYVCTGEASPRSQLHQEIAWQIINFLGGARHLVVAPQSP